MDCKRRFIRALQRPSRAALFQLDRGKNGRSSANHKQLVFSRLTCNTNLTCELTLPSALHPLRDDRCCVVAPKCLASSEELCLFSSPRLCNFVGDRRPRRAVRVKVRVKCAHEKACFSRLAGSGIFTLIFIFCSRRKISLTANERPAKLVSQSCRNACAKNPIFLERTGLA